MGDRLKFVVDKKNEGKKLVNFIKVELDFSTRLTRKLTKNGCIYINNKTGYSSDILKEGDRIEIDLSTEETQDIEPQDIPLSVVYEDDDLLIVNKPPSMVVHPTRSHLDGTLANAVTYYFRAQGKDNIVRLVNRIDRDTSGLVIIAKSQYAHMAMAKQLEANIIEKYYIAIVEGRMEGSGTIDAPIDRPSEISLKREVLSEGYRAVTHYEVLESSTLMSSLLIKLETGKTHQIRVHMSYSGHPIVGDTLYGSESPYINRQALHAYILRFKSLREDIVVEVKAPIPQDMEELMNIIEKNR